MASPEPLLSHQEATNFFILSLKIFESGADIAKAATFNILDGRFSAPGAFLGFRLFLLR